MMDIHTYRSQHLCHCMAAGRYPLGLGMPPISPGIRPELLPFWYGPYGIPDPRLGMYRPPEEPKPQHTYVKMIAMAILSHPNKKLVVSDIFKYFLDNFPYFRARKTGWKNSIRHNLTIHSCFIQSGRNPKRRGHYWAVHPANVDDFKKGDFRVRRAHMKVRKYMGLAVDDDDSPSPPSSSPPPTFTYHQMAAVGGPLGAPINLSGAPQGPNLKLLSHSFNISAAAAVAENDRRRQMNKETKRSDNLEKATLGQDRNASSNDEDHGCCHHMTRLPSDPSLVSSQMMLRFPGPNRWGTGNGGQFLHSHPSMSPHNHYHPGLISQRNMPHHGVITPLDILQAHQIIQHQLANYPGRGPQGFEFGPHGLQQNPALASHAYEVPGTHF